MAWIRGAICAENNIESIKAQTIKLFDEIVVKNGINLFDIEAVSFTVTDDLDVAYPAKFLREKFAQLSNVAFMCMQEMKVVGSLDHCIRVCVHAKTILSQIDIKHCYLDGAEKLRPDLTD